MEASALRKEKSLFDGELRDSIERLKRDAPDVAGTAYFFQIVEDYFSIETWKTNYPDVIVLGSSMPEELVHAFDFEPHWVLGGSLGAASWSNSLVPRDTDAVSRSMLGFVQNEYADIADKALLLIPITGDSGRKISNQLRYTGKKVCTLDIPPVKDAFAPHKWNRQLEQCVEALSLHSGKRFSQKRLGKAELAVDNARKQMRQLVRFCHENPYALSGSFRMFLLYSYYCTSNIRQWTSHMKQFNAELGVNRYQCGKEHRPNILLLGSPVYFPNYKIPFLLEDAGLYISATVDYTTQKMFSRLEDFLKQDCSGSYVKNDSLFRHVSELIAGKHINGVVYHVLKGQIEYDFELDRFEKLFEGYDIPVIRLETDYSYQDVEQLRIRIEAFMEMLSQNGFQRDRYAV